MMRPRTLDGIAAALLLANGLAIIALSSFHTARMLTGVVCLGAAWLVWTGRATGHAAALLAWALQAVSYYAIPSGWNLLPNWVVSVAMVVPLSSGIMVLNVLALALVALHGALLWRRLAAGIHTSR